MKIMAIGNQKGGVGKTTTVMNLSAALAQTGRKVLMIDLDPQANLSKYAGYHSDQGPTIGDLLHRLVNGQPLGAEDAIRSGSEGVHYIPSDIRLAGADFFLINAMMRELVLKRVLSEPIFKAYDYILIDCLPSLGILLINALSAAHSLIIPVQTQAFSLDGLNALLCVFQSVKGVNPGLYIEGIVATMADGTNMSKAVIEALRERFAADFYNTCIGRSVEAANSTYQQRSLISGKSKLGTQYRALADEILDYHFSSHKCRIARNDRGVCFNGLRRACEGWKSMKKISFSNDTTVIDSEYAGMFGFSEGSQLIRQIPIEMLHDYPNQPFKSYPKSKLAELAADIAVNGILNPLCVRTMANGYQILAGHNRRSAAALAGLAQVPCIIRDVDDDMAAIIVTTTNLNQREKLLPSEKAYAFKMQLEAIKRQGDRKNSTCGQVVHKSRDSISEDESGRQIQRYIRLTFLVPKLLQMVDEDAVSFVAGVNLSYHNAALQRELVEFLDANELTKISLKQSEEIKRTSDLTEKRLMEIFGLRRPSPKPARAAGRKTVKAIETYFSGRGLTDSEIADIIVLALEKYEKQRE